MEICNIEEKRGNKMDRLYELLGLVSTVVTIASAVAAMTPTKKDDNLVGKVRGFIDLLALNVGNAKPKDK